MSGILKLLYLINGMGNQTLKRQQQIIEHVSSPHPMLPNCKKVIIGDNKLLSVTWPFTNRQEYDRWVIKFEAMTSRDNKQSKNINEISSLYFIPISHQYIDGGICGPLGLVELRYDYVEKTLLTKIQQQYLSNNPFVQEDIWIFLSRISKSIGHLHQKQIQIEDLKIQNIFIGSSMQQVKICLNISWVNELSIEDKIKNGQTLLLSPEKLNQIYAQEQTGSKKKFSPLNDSYSLGATLSQIMLLNSFTAVYKTINGYLTINKEAYQQMIENIIKIGYYSTQLKIIVLGLLQLNPNYRITIQELLTFLKFWNESTQQKKVPKITEKEMLSFFGEKLTNVFKKVELFKSSLKKKMFKNNELHVSRAMTTNNLQLNKINQNISNSNIIYDFSKFSFVKQMNSARQPLTHQRNVQSNSSSPKTLQKMNKKQSNLLESNVQQMLLTESKNADIIDFQANSIVSQVESINIPFVYTVNHPPSSYVSYHYSNSNSNGQSKEEIQQKRANTLTRTIQDITLNQNMENKELKDSFYQKWGSYHKFNSTT